MEDHMEKKKKTDPTLKELVTGILVLGFLGEIAGLLFVRDKLYYTSGWWFGIALSVFMAWHMWWSLNRGLDLGEQGAPKYLVRANLIRYLVVAVGYAALAVLDFGNPIAAFAGILMLKASAYLQPFVHKCYHKIFHRKLKD